MRKPIVRKKNVGESILRSSVTRRYLIYFLASSLLLPIQALAAGLVFSGAWARATVPNASSAALYGSFRNEGDQPLSIQKITTNVAGMIMLHRSVLESGMMKMSAVGELSLSPGEVVELKPGGLHMMLTALKQSLVENEIIYVKVFTSDGKSINAAVTVGSIGQMSAPQEIGTVEG